MPTAPHVRSVAVLSIAILLFRIVSAIVVAQPGYTDAYYYTNVAERLARGGGLTADFVWSPLETTTFELPVTSHQFWVPLATAIAALGIAIFGPLLGTFRAAQLPLVAIATLLPPAAFVAARSLGVTERTALFAAAIVGLGGLFAPGFVAVDAFAPAAFIGTAFFLAYRRAATGSVRAGILAGALVGLLYLARSEGALFGLALLALLRDPRTRVVGAAGSAVALAIGGAWLARQLSVGVGADLFARSALLGRYDQLFAIDPAYASSLAELLAPRAGALLSNAVTLAFAFALVLLFPLAVGLRALWARADVRAWALLLALVYAAQSLVWTLHSTRGSYFHSLAAFFPFGVAIAAAGAERLLAGRTRASAAGWSLGAVMVVAVVSVGAVSGWDGAFNTAARQREAVVDAIPAGTFLAIDAAAWRWVSGRSVVVTPSDGIAAAGCVAAVTGATSIVLEEAHFAAYDALYQGSERPSWLGEPIVRGTTKVFPVTAPPDAVCAFGPR